MRRERRQLISLAVGLMLVTAGTGHAAVRVCGEVIAVAGEDRGSEQVARKKAMDSWVRDAGRYGPAFTGWRLATDRSFSCLTLADGTWRCQAYGRPCGIAQNPNRLPPGTVVQTAPGKSD